MKSSTRRAAVACAIPFLLTGSVVAGAGYAAADGVGHTAYMKNNGQSRATMELCRQWGSTTCSKGGWYLEPGQRSLDKYGKVDIDGFKTPAGLCAYNLSNYRVVYNKGSKTPRWFKVSPPLVAVTMTYRLGTC